MRGPTRGPSPPALSVDSLVAASRTGDERATAGGGEAIEGVTGAAGVCLHTPGHTRGSICYHFPAFKLVLTGDTLFK